MTKRRSTKKATQSIKTPVLVCVLIAAVLGLFFFFKNKPHPLVQKHPVQTQVVQKIHKRGPIPGSAGKIAIILDDWGQSLDNCKYLKEIPEPMAVSILPDLRHSVDVAKCAHPHNKLVMLHLPLQALNNHDIYPKDYIITTAMSTTKVQRIVRHDLAGIPFIEGVNNHMGSRATQDKNLMRTIFRILKQKDLFYVDSVTVHGSVCPAMAKEVGLSFGRRDVFLDDINTRKAIITQLHILAAKAHRRGYAVAIGHDRHLTMQVLKEQIPLLEQQGFELVSIKSLVHKQ